MSGEKELSSFSSGHSFKDKSLVLLDHWGWLILLAVSPFLLFPSASRSPMLLVVPLLLWTQRCCGRSRIVRTPLDLPIALTALMVLVSLYATFDITLSFPKIAGILFGIGLYYAIVVWAQQSGSALAQALGLHIGLGAGIAGLGLISTDWGSKIQFLAPVISRLPPRLVTLPGRTPA